MAGGANPRTYQLHISVPHEVTIVVGRLGTFTFAAGTYVYTGSARRNIDARIRRHVSAEKRLRWHIDYLLAANGVAVVDVTRSTVDECSLNQRIRGEIPAPGFGASDCHRRCGSHLKYLGPGAP